MAAMLAIVIALAMLQGAAPAQAQTATVLVKNTGQMDDGADISLASSFPKQAQAFRTGSNSEGYNLTSIAIRFDTISDTSTAKSELTATLNEVSSGNPGSALCTLVTPDLTSTAANTFAAPSDGTCPVLQPSTSYYVVLDRTAHSEGTIVLQLTTSDNEDDGGADGWTIDNTTKEYSSSWSTTSNSRALMIEVKGSAAVPDPTLLVKNTDQATYSPLDVTLRAQGFTTGTAPGGYNLTSIGVLFDQIGDVSEAPNVITATINEVNGTGPGTVFCTLGHPSAYVADSVNTYDASSCSTLSRNTPYFVVLNRTDMTAGGTISIRRTASFNEDGTPATGWSIADRRQYLPLNGSWTTAAEAHLIEIRGAAVPDPPKRVTGFDLHSSNSDPRGMWGNEDTFWVANDGSGAADKLYAYNRSDGSRDTTNDFENLNGAGNNEPEGICSDGTTMFVADSGDDKLYAYKMSDTTADSTKDITLDSDNGEPRGMWCDETTVYVANDGATTANKVFAYTISSGAHDSSKDFEELYLSTNTAAQNAETPRGIWSNGATMFVADDDDDNVFAYKHSDESQDSGKNLALISDNDNPRGMWFDGRILWVVDGTDDTIYPYDLPAGQPDNAPADGDPRIGSAFTKDVFTATVSPVTVLGVDNVTGYAVSGVLTAGATGSISESEFTVDGVTYTVRAVLDSNYLLNFGSLYLELDRELPRGFTITADGVSYSSGDATDMGVGTAHSYLWSASLSWTATDSIPVVLSVETPKDGVEVSADVSGITDSTDGVASASYQYQWIRVDGTDETDIGAVGATYTPTADDVDKHLKVRVVFDDDAGNEEYPLTSPRFGPVVEGVPPTLLGAAATAATTINVTFSEPLDPNSVPAASAFVVQVGGTAGPVDSAEFHPDSEDAIRLTVSTPLLSRDTITLSYAKPDGNPLQDPNRNEVESFTGQPVVNLIRETFVSNLGQTTSLATGNLATDDFAQRFDTGSTASFDFTEVEVLFDTAPSSSATVTAVIADGLNLSNNIVATLTNPLEWSANARFGIPSGTTLSKDTTYYLIIEGTDGILKTTTSNAEDSGAAANWTIGNAASVRTDETQTGLGGTWANSPTSSSLQMAVRGKHHGRPGTPELAVTAKDQTLILEVTVPDHGSSNLTGIEYSYKVTAGGAYTSWAPVTETVTNSGGTFEIGGLDNGTEYTAQVQTVNDIGTSDPSNEEKATPDAPPAITSVAITSDPGMDKTYAIDDDIVVTFTFDKNIEFSGMGAVPNIYLYLGTEEEEPDCAIGTAPTMTMACTHTVGVGDEDTDGIRVGPAIEQGQQRVVGPLDQYADLTHSGLAEDSDHLVDGVRPELTKAEASADKTKITLTFSEAIGSVDRTKITIDSGGTTLTTTADSITGSEVEITLTTALTAMDTDVTVALAADAVTDAVGNGIAAVPATSLTTATATVTISGKPRVTETLTVAVTDISDPEGVTNIDLQYQWTRDDGTDVTDISGASSATYTLTDADAEHKINVNVTFEDDEGNPEGPFTATATEAVVPTEVLVRNIGQSPESAGEDFDNLSPTKIAQAFTTGANSDGYALTSIGVHFHTIANTNTAASRITATLNEDSSGLPGAALCTLTDPPSFSASGLHAFTAPATDRCTVLEANTIYWVALVNDASHQTRLTVTTSSSEDSGGLGDWLIADSHHQFTGSNQWVNYLDAILIEFRGENAVPNATATGVPTISGTPHEGSTLTAGTSGIADGNGLGTLKYQWVRVTGTVQTDIDGATASTYTLTADDLDKTIIVKVSFIDQDGHPEGPLSSAATAAVIAPNLLVKNTLAGVNTIPTQASDPRIGQAFTTGSSLAGYQLASVGFRLHAIDDPASAGTDLEVTLNEVASSGEPGAALCTLEDPGTFVANSINRFSAPSGDDCPKLSRNTTYFAVLHRVAFTGSNAITIGVATNSAQDDGSAANWSIADTGYSGTGTTWTASILNYRIEVTGEEGIEVEVPQGWSLTPTGFVGGQKFRLLFVTAANYSPAETDIEKYNDYVQDQASFSDAPADIRAYHSHFRVLGSTADVDARDNTRTNPNDYASVPIYWMGGDKVADNYNDFYDGSWDSETWTASNGVSSSNARNFWTGSNNDGTESFTDGVSNALGAISVRRGTLNGSGDPLTYFTSPQGTTYGYYALSNIFVVPNAEATGQPAVTGTPRVNETLTADTSGITDPEGTSNAVFTYQWVRVDGSEADIPNATGSTYRPKDEDADKKLKVRVSFTDNQGFEEGPLVSEPTALIAGRDVLVRNTSRTSNSSQGLTNNRQLRAQAFTTGAAEEGYNLDAIGFLFNNIASTTTAGDHLTATLNAETSGDPGNVLCTLTDPTSFTSAGLHSFTAPTSGTKCPTLTANMTYFAVINRVMVTSDAITLQITNSSGEDPGSVAGFSVGNDRHHSQTGSSWSDVSGQSYQIEVKGAAATEPIVSDHTTWVDNRQGNADTDYENLGSYSIAQGFRTGDTAGIFNVNEIHIDFDSGQTEYQKITLLITESTTPDAEVNTGRPSGFRKGGSFYSQEVDSDGTVTFPRHSGYKWLEANTNYFLIISSTSDDPNAAPTLRMTEHEGQDSSDGWSIDDQSYSKATAGGARWTRQDHQVRFRISGEYHQGLSLYLEPSKYESCPNKPCVVAVLETDENMGMEGRRFPGSLDSTTTTWISTQENIEFKAALWPIPTAGQWVEFDYNTSGWTATAGEDFINTQGTVLFSPGDKLNTIKVELIDDSIEDSGEQLRMRIGVYLTTTSDAGRTYQPGDFKVRTGGGYPFPEVTKYSAFGTILNSEEETETRWLKVSGATITEGEETAAQFTVSLTGTLTAPVWFNYATVDGSAVAGTHYTATSGETHIPHGATSVTVSVPILDFDDDVYTGNHQFTLQLSNITVAAVGTDSATATIRDDEPQPLTASFTNLPEGNHGESAFKFDISFNQDVATQRLVMQEDAMTVTNGEVTGAQRVDGDKSIWLITVEPVDGRDVTVELPVTTDCSATGAVCTGGDSPQPLSNSVTHTFPGTQLNAEFEGFDHHHDGSTPMQFRVAFSEEVDTTAAEIKDHALTVTGATLNTVVQKDEGSTRRWNVTVTPAGTGPFDVVLASATDCALDGHICTADGELLARGDWKRSSGPPVISVADAAVTEGDEAQLTFAVTLDRNWSGPIPTVSYATSDGTASARSDYTAGSGSLTLRWTQTGSLIRPWTLAGAITVPVTNDTVVEETETLTLTLSSPVWATLGDSTATGAIEDDDTAPEPVEPKADDSAPTGLPTITGTPEADSALTADTSAIDDANGLTGVSYSYQWIMTTGGADADIDGATARAYTPRTAHVGRTLKVRVSFTDDDDYEHTLTSEPTTPITKPEDTTVWSADMLVVEYTDVSIGAASADLFSNIGGTGNLQIKSLWSHVPDKDLRLAFTDTFDDAEDHTLIVGDLTLEFPAGSSGEQSFKWTNVELGWEDGQTIAVSIVPATPAEPVANTAATGQPTISGTPRVGQSLTAGTADIGDADGLDRVSYNYQWLAGDANIRHATARTHTPGVNDVGKTIRVKVSFTDDRGNAETLTSIATAAVLATVPTAPQGLTVTTGDQVQELDASWQAPSSNGGSAVTGYRVQWKEAADSWDTAADVSQATVTTTTHTITGLTGGVEYAVRVMATNDEGDGPASTAARGTPAAENNAPTGLPTISGTPQVGETLTASTSNIDDEDGLEDVAYRYQWVQNDGTDAADIAGETSSTYTLVDADEGQTIRVKVSFTDDADNDESLTSAATVAVLARPNRAAAGLPTIGGTPQVDETLTADTSAISDEDGLTNVSWSYQWSAGGSDIDGATGSTYTLTASELGQTIQVQATFTDDADNEETLTSQATVAVAAASNREATGQPAIGGTPQVGETLTADTSGITDADGLTNVSYAYQWLASGTDIDGATGSSYVLTSSEQGQTIQVRVTFTDDTDNDESLTSAATETVLARPNRAAAGLPTISGTPQVDETLTADTSAISDEDGLTNVSWSYQWTAGGTDIEGAASSTYTLVFADQGKTIKVKVSFTDDRGSNESLASVATVAVAAAPNREATGAPSIGGTPQVDQTLTADTPPIADEDGLTNATFEYQWTAGGSDIGGATGSTYTLTASEQGKTIQVQVTFTDDRGNAESLTSAATDPVAAKPTPLTVQLKVAAPATHDGSSEFTFEIEFSEEFGLSYATLKNHAFNVTGGSVERAQRTDKPSNIPWRITVKPQGGGDVTVELPATTDCGATGAICTQDGRKLSNSLSFTVSGPGG